MRQWSKYYTNTYSLWLFLYSSEKNIVPKFLDIFLLMCKNFWIDSNLVIHDTEMPLYDIPWYIKNGKICVGFVDTFGI